MSLPTPTTATPTAELLFMISSTKAKALSNCFSAPTTPGSRCRSGCRSSEGQGLQCRDPWDP